MTGLGQGLELGYLTDETLIWDAPEITGTSVAGGVFRAVFLKTTSSLEDKLTGGGVTGTKGAASALILYFEVDESLGFLKKVEKIY